MWSTNDWSFESVSSGWDSALAMLAVSFCRRKMRVISAVFQTRYDRVSSWLPDLLLRLYQEADCLQNKLSSTRDLLL